MRILGIVLGAFLLMGAEKPLTLLEISQKRMKTQPPAAYVVPAGPTLLVPLTPKYPPPTLVYPGAQMIYVPQ